MCLDRDLDQLTRKPEQLSLDQREDHEHAVLTQDQVGEGTGDPGLTLGQDTTGLPRDVAAEALLHLDEPAAAGELVAQRLRQGSQNLLEGVEIDQR